MQRIALLADVHGNYTALEAVLADAAHYRPDRYVVLGDLVVKGPEPQRVVDRVRELGAVVVRGNCEEVLRYFPPRPWKPRSWAAAVNGRNILYTKEVLSAEQQDWLLNLPSLHREVIGGRSAAFFHATPERLDGVVWPWAAEEDLSRQAAAPGSEMAVYGHIHHAFSRTVRGRLVVNPGSVGMPFDEDPRASYALLEVDADSVSVHLQRVAYDVEAAIVAARRAEMPDICSFAGSIRHGRYPFAADQELPWRPRPCGAD